MRVLIISAVLGCACAAPSVLLAPLPASAIAYAAVPTISPGDIQAAAIDAQVKAQDLTIASVDKARDLTFLAADNVNEQVVTNNDQIKEQAEENFWAGEEKKWQALDALKTAEAQYDGALASSASLLAKNAIATPLVVTPNIALAPTPVVAPVITPGIIAPVAKTVATEVKEEKVEAVAKSAEKMEDNEAVAVEAPKPEAVETPKLEAEVKALEVKPDAAASVVVPAVEPYRYPIVAPVVLPPMLKYGAVAPFPYIQHVGIAPIYNNALYKTW